MQKIAAAWLDVSAVIQATLSSDWERQGAGFPIVGGRGLDFRRSRTGR
jgi:hypothetical protein